MATDKKVTEKVRRWHALTKGQDFKISDLEKHKSDFNLEDMHACAHWLDELASEGLLKVTPHTKKKPAIFHWLWVPDKPEKEKEVRPKKKGSKTMRYEDRIKLLREVFPNGCATAQAVRKRGKLGFTQKQGHAAVSFLSLALKKGDLAVLPGKKTHRTYVWPDQTVPDQPIAAESKPEEAKATKVKKVQPSPTTTAEVTDLLSAKTEALHKRVEEINVEISKLDNERSQIILKLNRLKDIENEISSL